uniref:Uncharacterized protein n=1 Tax=Rhizophora mucronata TaxID=61149 RepID=A0A2P2JEF0_RHIMU
MKSVTSEVVVCKMLKGSKLMMPFVNYSKYF